MCKEKVCFARYLEILILTVLQGIICLSDTCSYFHKSKSTSGKTSWIVWIRHMTEIESYNNSNVLVASSIECPFFYIWFKNVFMTSQATWIWWIIVFKWIVKCCVACHETHEAERLFTNNTFTTLCVKLNDEKGIAPYGGKDVKIEHWGLWRMITIKIN